MALCPSSSFFNGPATTEIYTLSLHDALPIFEHPVVKRQHEGQHGDRRVVPGDPVSGGLLANRIDQESKQHQEADVRSEEHTSELQSQFHLVCRLLLEKKKKKTNTQRK